MDKEGKKEEKLKIMEEMAEKTIRSRKSRTIIKRKRRLLLDDSQNA
jgi:hypothetical protein